MTTVNTPSCETPLAVTFAINAYLEMSREFFPDPQACFNQHDWLSGLSQYDINALKEYGELSSKIEILSPDQAVIHLVRDDAIVLKILNLGGLACIDRLRVNVGKLLYGDEEQPVRASDIRAAHSLTIDAISPHLMNPLHSVFEIVPICGGYEPDDPEYDDLFYREVSVSMRIPDVELKDLYFQDAESKTLSCPGGDSIEVHDPKNKLVIYISDAPPRLPSMNEEGLKPTPEILLTVTFPFPRNSCGSTDEPFSFNVRHVDVAHHFHKAIMSLEAVHLPAPDAVHGESDIAMLARAIAMNQYIDGREGRLMSTAEHILNSRKASLREFKNAVVVETARLNPVPLSALIGRAYSQQASLAIPDVDWTLHPLIKAMI